jgi:hypothetical protein
VDHRISIQHGEGRVTVRPTLQASLGSGGVVLRDGYPSRLHESPPLPAKAPET